MKLAVNMICYSDIRTYKNENDKSITLMNVAEVKILANKTHKYIKMATYHDC